MLLERGSLGGRDQPTKAGLAGSELSFGIANEEAAIVARRAVGILARLNYACRYDQTASAERVQVVAMPRERQSCLRSRFA